MEGELLIRWTARLAVACYVARLICDISGGNSPQGQRWARWWWTVGCGIFLAHVLVAFHFEHHWNHAAAFDHTARRTAQLTGWNSGTGLYINELFLCLWVTDTIFWWNSLSYSRNRLAYGTVQSIFAFLMFQATAVFGPPFWRPIVLAVIVVFVLLAFLPRSDRQDGPVPSSSID